MSICNCGHGQRFHADGLGNCKAYGDGLNDYIPCICRHFDPVQWAERYDTDETGMLIEDAAQTAERLGGLRRCDDSLLQLPLRQRWKSERIRDVQLPD